VIGGNCTLFNYIEHIPAKRRQSFGSSGFAGIKTVITCYFWIHIRPFSCWRLNTSFDVARSGNFLQKKSLFVMIRIIIWLLDSVI